MKKTRIVIITGISGSGKTTSLKALEDINFFCIDNLPLPLLPKFLEIDLNPFSDIGKIALVIDTREGEFIKKAPSLFQELRQEGYSIEILYLEARDEVILRRFSETRRSHPVKGVLSVKEGIEEEKKLLSELKEMADFIIDTSEMSVHQLKKFVQSIFLNSKKMKKMSISVFSFGYKYGIPHEADLVFDVRFLPNPYFVENLKKLSGKDNPVKEYVLGKQETKTFLKKVKDFLLYLLPLYENEGKSYFNIAFGCTGGEHRSVVIAEEVAKELSKKGYSVNLYHRDIELRKLGELR